MRTQRLVQWLMLLIVALVLAGCARQAQEPATAPPDSSTATQPAEPPSLQPQPAPNQEPPKPAERAKAPDDFPLPLYDGFTVTNTIRTQAGGFKGMQVELVGDAAPETVAQFYEAEFNKRGLKVSTMNQQNEALVLGQSDTITAGVAASKEGNQTRLILSWSEKQ